MLPLAQSVGAVLIAGAALFLAALHKVEEGHVGVYYRGGALLDDITDPGFHLMMPLITSFHPVQTTLQSDVVENIACGTSGGVMIYFEKIECVNQLPRQYVHDVVRNHSVFYDKPLIFDKIHHEINQFCSGQTLQQVYIDEFATVDDRLQNALQAEADKYAPGLQIRAIRVSKPKIPETIRQNYERTEAEKTKLMFAVQEQKVVEKVAETERKKAVIEAEKEAALSAIRFEQQVKEKESLKEMARIEDEQHVARVKNNADAELYAAAKRAEANALELTPQFLELRRVEAIAQNTKVYFGERIPTFLGSTAMEGSLAEKAAEKEKAGSKDRKQ